MTEPVLGQLDEKTGTILPKRIKTSKPVYKRHQ